MASHFVLELLSCSPKNIGLERFAHRSALLLHQPPVPDQLPRRLGRVALRQLLLGSIEGSDIDPLIFRPSLYLPRRHWAILQHSLNKGLGGMTCPYLPASSPATERWLKILSLLSPLHHILSILVEGEVDGFPFGSIIALDMKHSFAEFILHRVEGRARGIDEISRAHCVVLH